MFRHKDVFAQPRKSFFSNHNHLREGKRQNAVGDKIVGNHCHYHYFSAPFPTTFFHTAQLGTARNIKKLFALFQNMIIMENFQQCPLSPFVSFCRIASFIFGDFLFPFHLGNWHVHTFDVWDERDSRLSDPFTLFSQGLCVVTTQPAWLSASLSSQLSGLNQSDVILGTGEEKWSWSRMCEVETHLSLHLNKHTFEMKRGLLLIGSSMGPFSTQVQSKELELKGDSACLFLRQFVFPPIWDDTCRVNGLLFQFCGFAFSHLET